jgi:EXPERA (EXPanded EBP superfamily)
MTARAVEHSPSASDSRGVERTPILRRPIDLLFIAFFSVSITYGFLFSLPEGLGVPVSADSPWPPLRALHDWAVAEEPAHLDPPPNLIAATLFDGLFQSPMLLFIVVGLVRQRRWLVPLGLVYSGAGTTNMFFYFIQTFLGDHPPPNTVYYLVFNLPWLLAPIALGCRVLLGRDLRH